MTIDLRPTAPWAFAIHAMSARCAHAPLAKHAAHSLAEFSLLEDHVGPGDRRRSRLPTDAAPSPRPIFNRHQARSPRGRAILPLERACGNSLDRISPPWRARSDLRAPTRARATPARATLRARFLLVDQRRARFDADPAHPSMDTAWPAASKSSLRRTVRARSSTSTSQRPNFPVRSLNVRTINSGP